MNESRADKVYCFVSSKLNEINTLSDTRQGKAILAQLRRGIGKAPGELPELWGMIFGGLPEELMGKNTASNAEWAIYTALTLYALHRQGKEKDVNEKNISLGSAAAKLVKTEEDEERIMRRMNLIVTAVSREDIAYHARSMIQLLITDDICLDHAKFAKELYFFAYPDMAESVKLNWGRDFFRRGKGEDKNEE